MKPEKNPPFLRLFICFNIITHTQDFLKMKKNKHILKLLMYILSGSFTTDLWMNTYFTPPFLSVFLGSTKHEHSTTTCNVKIHFNLLQFEIEINQWYQYSECFLPFFPQMFQS